MFRCYDAMSYEAMRDQCSAQIFSLSLVLIITRQSRTPITTLTNNSSHLTFTAHQWYTCHVSRVYARTSHTTSPRHHTAHSSQPPPILPPPATACCVFRNRPFISPLPSWQGPWLTHRLKDVDDGLSPVTMSHAETVGEVASRMRRFGDVEGRWGTPRFCAAFLQDTCPHLQSAAAS